MQSEVIDERQSQYNPGYGEYQYVSSLCNLADRFLKLGYPAEAFVAYRKAFGDESLLVNVGRWGGNLERQRDTLSKQISDKTDEQTILPILEAATNASALGDSHRDGPRPDNNAMDMADFLTRPQIERESLINTRVTMPLEEFTVKLAGDKNLAQAVSTWLQTTPIDETSSRSLKCLVARLLISDAVHDVDGASEIAIGITEWMHEHPAAREPVRLIESTGDDSQEDRTNIEEHSQPTSSNVFPDELLLGMAALRMPDSTATDDIVTMLDRAAIIAVANREDALAQSALSNRQVCRAS